MDASTIKQQFHKCQQETAMCMMSLVWRWPCTPVNLQNKKHLHQFINDSGGYMGG